MNLIKTILKKKNRKFLIAAIAIVAIAFYFLYNKKENFFRSKKRRRRDRAKAKKNKLAREKREAEERERREREEARKNKQIVAHNLMKLRNLTRAVGLLRDPKVYEELDAMSNNKNRLQFLKELLSEHNVQWEHHL